MKPTARRKKQKPKKNIYLVFRDHGELAAIFLYKPTCDHYSNYMWSDFQTEQRCTHQPHDTLQQWILVDGRYVFKKTLTREPYAK